jgi:hypothetical protein
VRGDRFYLFLSAGNGRRPFAPAAATTDMAIDSESTLVDFDADAAVDAAGDVAGDDLLVAVEFTDDDHETLHVADAVVEMYGGEASMREHFEEIQSYVHVDFTERQLFEDVVGGGDVRAVVTYMDHATLARVLNEREGLFVTLSPSAPVTPVVETVEDVLAERSD